MGSHSFWKIPPLYLERERERGKKWERDRERGGLEESERKKESGRERERERWRHMHATKHREKTTHVVYIKNPNFVVSAYLAKKIVCSTNSLI